jgi:hypothetical protein
VSFPAQVVLRRLLSDTELGKDISKDLVGGDFSGDFAQVVKHLADVLGKQV